MRLDAKGEQETIEAIEALWTRLDKVQEASDKRSEKTGDDAPVFVAGHVLGQDRREAAQEGREVASQTSR